MITDKSIRKMGRVLSSDDKCIGDIKTTGGALSMLFRKILTDRNINGNRWGKYMFDFLTNPINGVPNNTRDRTGARGNMNKEFFRDEMTLKVFMKALRFLKAAKVKFIIELEDEYGEKSRHETDTMILSRKRLEKD